jgi:(p)ppGpp synthase/HD superfamily hydrolase
MFTLTDAIIIAAEAHRGVKDCGGVDYILHPLYIMHKLKMKGYGLDVLITAVLHDVVEDTNWTVENLIEKGCPESSVIALKLLTHVRDQELVDAKKQEYIKKGFKTSTANATAKDDEYFIYINRLSKNDIARAVKIEDLRHNGDIRRAPDDVYENRYTRNRWAKYANALNILTGGKVGYV